MRISYKLTKRTTKIEKIEKSSKMYNIIDFKVFAINLELHHSFNFQLQAYEAGQDFTAT